MLQIIIYTKPLTGANHCIFKENKIYTFEIHLIQSLCKVCSLRLCTYGDILNSNYPYYV